MNEYNIFMEWKIRKLNPPPSEPKEDYDERCKRWILYSLGFDEKAQEIYLFIDRKKFVTVDEISSELGLELDYVQNIVDELYSYGLVERIGRAYFVKDTLSESIVKNLIPRLVDTLRTIAKVDSTLRVKGKKFRGEVFSDVRDFITRYRDILDSGGKVKVRVIGIIPYSGEGVEERGIVQRYDYWDEVLDIITFDGRSIAVGSRNKGVDIVVKTIIVEGV